jgi:hypothetical protein
LLEIAQTCINHPELPLNKVFIIIVKISLSKGMYFGSCYRDRISIISDILEVANGDDGASRTRIMYNANLSHYQMKNYVRSLVENHVLYYDLHALKSRLLKKALE